MYRSSYFLGVRIFVVFFFLCSITWAISTASSKSSMACECPPKRKCAQALARAQVQHTSAYVCIRQHPSAYVSIRQHTSAYGLRVPAEAEVRPGAVAETGQERAALSVFVLLYQSSNQTEYTCCGGRQGARAAVSIFCSIFEPVKLVFLYQSSK